MTTRDQRQAHPHISELGIASRLAHLTSNSGVPLTHIQFRHPFGYVRQARHGATQRHQQDECPKRWNIMGKEPADKVNVWMNSIRGGNRATTASFSKAITINEYVLEVLAYEIASAIS